MLYLEHEEASPRLPESHINFSADEHLLSPSEMEREKKSCYNEKVHYSPTVCSTFKMQCKRSYTDLITFTCAWHKTDFRLCPELLGQRNNSGCYETLI